MQLAVLQWARFYRSINEMLPSDKPDDETIENDEKLDRWFDKWVRESARKSGRKMPLARDDDKYEQIRTFQG